MRRYLIGLLALLLLALGAPACSPKSGCEVTTSLGPPIDKKGELKKGSKARSGLFPKKMARKMKR